VRRYWIIDFTGKLKEKAKQQDEVKQEPEKLIQAENSCMRNDSQYSSLLNTNPDSIPADMRPTNLVHEILPLPDIPKHAPKINLDKIPKFMQNYKKWIYWKYETKGEGEKPAKVPYQFVNTRAKVNDSSTWHPFGNIRDWQEKGFSGVGFVLNENDPFVAIDLDNCMVNGKANEFAQKVVNYFNSYTEISPSGKGLHIFVWGKIARALKRPEIEIYATGRYMAMTGAVYLDAAIEKRQAQLDKTMEKYIPAKTVYVESSVETRDGKFTMPNCTFGNGSRNNELARWAGILWRKGLGQGEYFYYLNKINMQCCAPPLPASEVNDIGKSILRYKGK
jgi:hypothetical protein